MILSLEEDKIKNSLMPLFLTHTIVQTKIYYLVSYSLEK